MIQAGTVTSVRRRDEPNSFNMIHVDRMDDRRPRITVERWTWSGEGRAFAASTADRFTRKGGEWRGTEGQPLA